MNPKTLITAFLLLWSQFASAQGVIPVALAQQSDLNGRPLAGALLYIYQVGTVGTPQDTFQDFGLTIPYPWPLRADTLGRVPMFYLANGQVHARLTDANGVVQFDYPNLQVIGPSSGGGGGGGGGVDPTSVMSTGDIKFRPTIELLPGWVKLNGQTIGNASSGASGRANGDTQALFIYLWANCTNPHCPVSTGRGGTALADFNGNKTIALPDWRARGPVGLDDMGSTASGRLLNSNVTSGGGDTAITPGATGGEANHTMTVQDLVSHNHTLTDPGHKHGITVMRAAGLGNPGATNVYTPNGSGTTFTDVGAGTFGGDVGGTGISIANTGSSTPFNNMSPFVLGSWHMKL